MTFTSPTVYISLETAYASDRCSQVGKRHMGSVLAMDPADVSSLSFPPQPFLDTNSLFTPVPVKYGDLQGIVPVSAYEAQSSCAIGPNSGGMGGSGKCLTIYPDYAPILQVPSQIRALDSAWASCGLDLRGLYDPPVAMTETTMADPTYRHTKSPMSSPPPATPSPPPHSVASETDPQVDHTATATSSSGSMPVFP